MAADWIHLTTGEIYVKLTAREMEIKEFLIQGLSGKQISEKLNIKMTTVKFHSTRLYRKEGVKSKYQLFAKNFRKVP